MADLRHLKHTWDELGRRDALGVILDYPLKLGDWNVEQFLETGRREIASVLESALPFGVPRRFRRALDFGCGAGRLTQAMCDRFDEVDGVDIAPSMLEAARALNRHPDRCRYHLNEQDSLALFGDDTFDFVYSSLTLQHMQPRFARRYLEEFVRVLAPGGLLVFQLPSERTGVDPLPPGAFRAEIVPEAETLDVAVGSQATVTARVRNAGDTAWPAERGPGEIALGNHWWGRFGRPVAYDDGRAPLSAELRPGEEATLELTVTAPAKPGRYTLELDMVQEGVAWFAERGSAPARVKARVTRAAAAAAEATDESAPVMEMHGIARADVVALLESQSARVLDVVENDAAGPGWISLRYAATKD